MIVDLFEFARQGRTAEGELPIARLSRVETPDRRGSLAWRARGSLEGRHGAPRLDLAVDGDVVLTCQRCLQPMNEPVHVVTRLLVADDEDAAEALDQDDDFDVVVGSTAFDLDQLIEDEVILALPSAPRHAVCPDGAADAAAAAAKRPSPFAALAALKGGADGNGVSGDDGGDEDEPGGGA